MSKVVRFDDLPLGGRFRYLSRAETWVKLDGSGEGRVVKFVPIGSSTPQTVCSAVLDEARRKKLRVHACDAIVPSPEVQDATPPRNP